MILITILENYILKFLFDENIKILLFFMKQIFNFMLTYKIIIIIN